MTSFPSRTSSFSRSHTLHSLYSNPKDAKGFHNTSHHNLFQRTDSMSTGLDLFKKMSSATLSGNTNLTASDYLASPRRDHAMQSRNESPLGRSVIIKSNDPCLENEYTEPIDGLLEEGFAIVSERKDVKESFKKKNEQLEREILKLNKEILPEIERTKQLKDMIIEREGVKTKHISDIGGIENEIRKTRELIEKKRREAHEAQEGLVGHIGDIENEIAGVKDQILYSRENEQAGLFQLTQKIVNARLEDSRLKEDIKTLRKRVEVAKNHQVYKNKALESKAMTYMGMIQRK